MRPQQQSDYLEQLAESELSAQKQRLAAYAVQARFALADIYDRASDRSKAATSRARSGSADTRHPMAPAPASAAAPRRQ